MYEPGKILYVGGGPPTNTAEIIDLNQSSPAWSFTGSMAFARRQMNATVLPTGQVLVTGGTSGSGFNNPVGAVHAAEMWDPATGVWTTMASNAVTRIYHSTTLLLPDGRVLHTGSGDGAGAVDELSYEIYSPPYLFKGARPSITGTTPNVVGYGQSLFVGTPDGASITKVTFAHRPREARMGLHAPIGCRGDESMHGAEELELQVGAEATLGKFETGDPGVVSGRIGAKVYCCHPDAQIKGRGTLARAERTN